MATDAKRAGGGRARFVYRLRVSSTACAALEAEWDRCRWLWNECVAKSRQAGAWNRTRPDGAEKRTCGPVQLAAMLTEARARTEWLREGACVPQQQLVRDVGRSRAKALKDIRARLPMRQRAGMPKYKKKRGALPALEYTRRGFRLREGRLHLAGGTVVRVVWSRDLPKAPSSVRVYRDSAGAWYASFVVPAVPEGLPATGRVIGIDWGVTETATTTSDDHDLPHPQYGKNAAQRLAKYQALAEMARKHGRAVYLVHPAHTTMDCAQCGARTKHALPLSERTYACTACGAVSPGDKNSARVMLVRAGLQPGWC